MELAVDCGDFIIFGLQEQFHLEIRFISFLPDFHQSGPHLRCFFLIFLDLLRKGGFEGCDFGEELLAGFGY